MYSPFLFFLSPIGQLNGLQLEQAFSSGEQKCTLMLFELNFTTSILNITEILLSLLFDTPCYVISSLWETIYTCLFCTMSCQLQVHFTSSNWFRPNMFQINMTAFFHVKRFYLSWKLTWAFLKACFCRLSVCPSVCKHLECSSSSLEPLSQILPN